MTENKTTRQNRVREALGRIYENEPPYFREYLRRFEEDPTSRVFAPLAEAYRRLGRLDEAIAICREGLMHHPDFHGGRVALAKCYYDKKAYADARGELERVVSVAPENLLAQRLLGDTCVILGERPPALHHYKMALLLSPNDVALAEKVHALERDDGFALDDEILADSGTEAETSLSPTPVEEAAPLWDAGSASASGVPPLQGREETKASPLWPLPGDGDDSGEISLEGDPPLLSPEPPELSPSPAEAANELELEALLGEDSAEEESFKIEHVSSIFQEDSPAKAKEITTATLGDLYFSQGQFDQALRIFERLNGGRASPDLVRKINACRAKLGVDREALVRNRQIETLRGVLRRVRSGDLLNSNPK